MQKGAKNLDRNFQTFSNFNIGKLHSGVEMITECLMIIQESNNGSLAWKGYESFYYKRGSFARAGFICNANQDQRSMIIPAGNWCTRTQWQVFFSRLKLSQAAATAKTMHGPSSSLKVSSLDF